MKFIPLSKGRYAVVSDEDYAYLSQNKWTFSSSNSRGRRGYAFRRETRNGKTVIIRMHHEVLRRMGYEIGPGLEADHINRDELDNRRSNLRIGTRRQNLLNIGAHEDSSSRYKGVSRSENGKKWIVQFWYLGKYEYRGRYDSEEDAALAYNQEILALCPKEDWDWLFLNQIPGIPDPRDGRIYCFNWDDLPSLA